MDIINYREDYRVDAMVGNDCQRERTSSNYSRRGYLKMFGGAAAATAVAGCSGSGGGGGGGDGETTSATTGSGSKKLSGRSLHFITVAQAGGIKELWNSIASDFESKTGASVNVEFVQTNSLDRIVQLLQAGNPPEVAQLSVGDAFQLLSGEEVLRPLNEEFKAASNRLGKPTDSVKKLVTVEGQTWLVPFMHNINTYSYRSDLTDIVPDTWDKALEYARVVDEQDNDVRGTYVPITGSPPGAIRLWAWLYMRENGRYAQWKDDRIDVCFNDEPYRTAMVDTLNYLKKRQQYSPAGQGAGWADIQNIIQTERAASSWYGGVRQKNAAIRNGRSFAKDVKILPGMPVGSRDIAVASNEGFVSFKQADSEVAKAFIDYVANKEFLTNLLTQLSPIHNVPSWPEIKESDAYMNGIQSLDLWDGWSMEQFENYQVKAFSKMQDNAMDTSPPNPYQVTYRSEPIYNLLGDVLRSNADPENVIDKRAKELQKVVDDAQSS